MHCFVINILRRLGVFENKVLRKTVGPKRDKVARDWRRQHNEELHVLCSSRSISLLWGGGDKCRKWCERCLWFVWGTEEVHMGFGWGNLSERGHLEDHGLGGRIILKRIFKIVPSSLH
jgi:hypothetical protein